MTSDGFQPHTLPLQDQPEHLGDLHHAAARLAEAVSYHLREGMYELARLSFSLPLEFDDLRAMRRSLRNVILENERSAEHQPT